MRRCRGPRRNHLCRFVLRSLTGFGRGRGQILGFFIDLLRRPYNTLVRVCDICLVFEKIAFLHQDPRWRISAILDFMGPIIGSLKKERIVLGEIHLRTTGRHLSVGSHSIICHPTEVTFTPTGQVGTRFIDPIRMKGWVGLVDWLHTEMVYPSTVTHPGTNQV